MIFKYHGLAKQNKNIFYYKYTNIKYFKLGIQTIPSLEIFLVTIKTISTLQYFLTSTRPLGDPDIILPT